MKRTRRDEIDTLLEQTTDPNPKVRAQAVQSLCPCHVKRNDARVWDRVLDLVEDPALEVRRWVFHLLGDGSPREREAEIVAAMERLTRDPDRKLQRRARQVLGRISTGRNDQRSIESLGERAAAVAPPALAAHVHRPELAAASVRGLHRLAAKRA